MYGHALGHRQADVLARLHVGDGLEARRGAAEHTDRPGSVRAHHGDVAGVVARRGVELLVARLVLLVHDDQAEVLDGREDGAPRADDDRVDAVADARPGVEALAGAHPAVDDRDAAGEVRVEAADGLRRERDLGHEHDGRPALNEARAEGAEVDLGLARARHAVEQKRPRRVRLDGGDDLIERFGLGRVKVERGRRGRFGGEPVEPIWAALDVGVEHLDEAAAGEGRRRRGARVGLAERVRLHARAGGERGEKRALLRARHVVQAGEPVARAREAQVADGLGPRARLLKLVRDRDDAGRVHPAEQARWSARPAERLGEGREGEAALAAERVQHGLPVGVGPRRRPAARRVEHADRPARRDIGPAGEGRPESVAPRAEPVARDPPRERDQLGRERRARVEHVGEGARLVGRLGARFDDDARERPPPEMDEHAGADRRLGHHLGRDAVREHALDGSERDDSDEDGRRHPAKLARPAGRPCVTRPGRERTERIRRPPSVRRRAGGGP